MQVTTADGRVAEGRGHFDSGLEALVVQGDHDPYPFHIAAEHVVWIKEIKDA